MKHTFGGVLRSEWIKLWSVRSTWWCLAIVLVIMVGLSLLVSSVAGSFTSGTGANVNTVASDASLNFATIGVAFAQLVVGVLGCLVITGEFGTGMIRTTFLATPRRATAVAGKALLFALVILAFGIVAIGLSAVIASGLLSLHGVDTDLSDGHYWQGLAGAVLDLALIGLFAVAIGTLLRNSAGAIATTLGILFVLPIIVSLLGSLTRTEWIQNAGSFLPAAAGERLYAYQYDPPQVDPSTFQLEPWQGGLVLVAWVVVLGALAIVTVRRRDV